jgi:hypothetical protein
VRATNTLRWGFTIMVALMVPLFIYWWTWVPTAGQRQELAAAAVFLYGLWFICFVGMAPPYVKVSDEQVSVWGDYGGWLRQRIPRKDVAYIFRGQGMWGRGGWGPAYFLVTRDNTPQILISAADFNDDGMVELAKRLSVPMKGDFSAQVR